MGAQASQARQTGAIALRRPAPAGGVPAPVIQAKGRLALQRETVDCTTEKQLDEMDPDSEEEVLLARGVTPTQKKYLDTEMIRGSFISFQKMMAQAGDHQQPDAIRPDKTDADDYVSQRRTPGATKLIEFSTKPDISRLFAGEARYGYVFTILDQAQILDQGFERVGRWLDRGPERTLRYPPD